MLPLTTRDSTVTPMPAPRVAAAPVDAVSAADWQALLGGAALTPTELQVLNGLHSQRRLSPGEPVFTRHQPARQLIAVLDGAVGLGLLTPGSPFHLQRSVHGPQWLDLSSAWLGGNHGQDAVTLGKATVVELPLQRLREWLLQEPRLGEHLLLGLARNVASLAGITHDLMHKDAEHRLAVWLLQRCQRVGSEVLVSLQERKRDIAAQLAITPETLSRILRLLQRKGLVAVQGYTVRVHDLPALEALARD